MDNSLLDRGKNSSQHQTVDDRKNIYIIFAEFSDAETSTIISFLRENQFAPRGYNLDSLDELQEVLSQRSWELILCKAQTTSLNPFDITKTLAHLEKDIPVLQSVKELNQESIAQSLLHGMQAVFPADDRQLLLLHINREIGHLHNRRASRRLQLQLSESQKRCKSLMDLSSLAVCFVYNQKIIYLNEAFSSQLGYPIKDLLLHKPVFNLLASQESEGLNNLISEFQEKGQNKQPYQVLAQRADNSHFTAHIQLKPVHFNGLNCIEISMDPKKNRRDEENFSKLDPITGLYNESYFDDALENQIRQAHQGGSDCHLIYIKALSFNQVKSDFGTRASRYLVRDIADILNNEFSSLHIKARIEDDIFCVLYLESSSDTTLEISQKLSTLIQQHTSELEGQTIASNTSIALIPITDTAPGVEKIYHRGKLALSQIENQSQETNTANHNDVILFNIEKAATKSELQSAANVKQAIEENKLRLLYQPLVPLAFENDQEHYEVLLRMIGDNNENIPPNQFLTSVDLANLNEEMDRWVLQCSINRFKIERNQNKSLKLFISVTDTVWEKQELLLWLVENLRQSRIESDRIVIQISETEASAKLAEAKFFVDGLRKLNCLISLKHFGSTNHSQDVLKILNPDYVKLDGSYITELSESNILDESFKSMLANLKALGKITIAPQVETPKIMTLLWKSGVCMMQGYYLQAPQEEMDYEF